MLGSWPSKNSLNSTGRNTIEGEQRVNSEQALRSRYRTRNLIALLALFVILFLITPFELAVRIHGIQDYGVEIGSVFYWIHMDSIYGFRIDAPFPSGMNSIPNPFWWMSWVEVIFSLAIIGYYRGLISHKATYRIGLASLGPGILTAVMGVALSGLALLSFPFPYLAAGFPIPIPAILGLYLVKFRPLDKASMWIEESQAQIIDTPQE